MQRLVKVTKLKAVGDPDVPTPKWEGYVVGQDNGLVSLPVDYTIKGIERYKPEAGKIYSVRRTERNGKKVTGEFTSSLVKSIVTNLENDNLIVTTQNSVYTVEYLKADWYSVAKWPTPEVNLGTWDNTDDDNHGSGEYGNRSAEAVVGRLLREGFGGEGKIFPVMAWAELREVKQDGSN